MSPGDITPAEPAPATSSTTAAASAPSEGQAAGEELRRVQLAEHGPEIVELAKQNPAILAAVEFREAFRPLIDSDGKPLDYEWVVKYAEWQFDQTLKIYNDLDTKATSILTHLGSGTGVLTLGTVAAVSGGAVSPWVGLAAVVPFGFAVVALLFAVAARRTNLHSWPPTIAGLTRYAEASREGRPALLGYLAVPVEVMDTHGTTRANLINRALSFMVAAVIALLLPLGVAVGLKLKDEAARTDPPKIELAK